MRVLVLVHAFPPVHCAGAEMTAFALLRHLAARGHRVDVSLTVQDGEPYTIDGLHVYPYEGPADPLRWFGDPDRRPDLVVTYLDSSVRSAILCRMHGIPLCHLIHNTFDFSMEMVARGPSDLVTYHADWVQAEYEDFLEEYALGGIPPNSIMVHPPVLREEYATTPGKHVTLINMWGNKGAKLFWWLAEQLPEVPFLAVKGGYGEQEIHDLPNVTVQEHIPATDMAAVVYHRTKILLMPSKYESYGRTAVEAACSGIPTIAHPTPGLREALGDAGTYVDRDDPEGWLKAIRYLRSSTGWSHAAHRARQVAARQDPIADMNRWCDLAEEVGQGGPLYAGPDH